MFVVWLVFAALTGLAALALGWWYLLCAMWPERLRTTEVHTVATGDLWQLRLCRYRKGRAPGEPVLLVHGANANHHNFTSPEGGCLVDHLVAKGYDCWGIDLRGCRSSQAPFERDPDAVTMDDYLLQDLPAAVDYILRRTGYDQVHWVGHSLGGMLLYAYAQRFGTGQIASGATLGAPTGFDGVRMRKPVELLFVLRWFRAPLGAAMRAFVPFALLAGRGFSLFPVNLRNRPRRMGAAHFFNMIENPLPNVLGELGFQINRKIWRMDGDRLDVKAGLAGMRLPLLAVYGVRDPFTPLEEARAFFDRLPTDDKQLLILGKAQGHKHDYDHCDLAFGEDGAREVFEPVARWIAAHPMRRQAADDAASPRLRPEERVQLLGVAPSGAPEPDPEIVTAVLPPPPAAPDEIVAVPVDLEHTAASALAALEKRLSKTLAETAKPTRSDRIRKAASTLDAVAGRLSDAGDTPRIPRDQAVPKPKTGAKAKAKAAPAKKVAAKKAAATETAAKPASAKKHAAKANPASKTPAAPAKPKAQTKPTAKPTAKPKPAAKAKPTAAKNAGAKPTPAKAAAVPKKKAASAKKAAATKKAATTKKPPKK